MDVLADAEELMGELGVRFEANASEAAAAAMLAASVHYPIRGAVTFKGPVGVNVASDALANLASSGVTGGALVIVGEDYGEGSSIMQERSACLCDEIADVAARPAAQPALDRPVGASRVRAVGGQRTRR
jgi:TPP-dependent indolepyruvate ferredoxin oxidoreductase alpha subunit